jgi:hypothetical protein
LAVARDRKTTRRRDRLASGRRRRRLDQVDVELVGRQGAPQQRLYLIDDSGADRLLGVEVDSRPVDRRREAGDRHPADGQLGVGNGQHAVGPRCSCSEHAGDLDHTADIDGTGGRLRRNGNTRGTQVDPRRGVR